MTSREDLAAIPLPAALVELAAVDQHSTVRLLPLKSCRICLLAAVGQSHLRAQLFGAAGHAHKDRLLGGRHDPANKSRENRSSFLSACTVQTAPPRLLTRLHRALCLLRPTRAGSLASHVGASGQDGRDDGGEAVALCEEKRGQP